MRWLLITIAVFALTVTSIACEDGEEGAATRTPTTTEEASPEATSTPEATPTQIPGPTAIPGSETPFTVDGFEVQFTVVSRDLAESLRIRIAVLSGDAESFSVLDAWVTDENGRETARGAATLTVPSDTGEPQVATWFFNVPKTSQTFILHFPSGEAVDLSPLLP